jgi:nucleoside-diphosphate-sugar epimerase
VLNESADYIFHVGANLSHHKEDIQQQWKDNVIATFKLAEACKDKVNKFVFVSTGAVSDWYEDIPSGYINSIYNMSCF